MQKRSHEPIFWSLFGAGGVVSALALPGAVLVTGLAWPLGLIPADALDHARISAFAASLPGALILLAVIALSLWHAAHRIFHSLHDFGVHRGLDRWKRICYGTAVAGAAWAALALIVVRF